MTQNHRFPTRADIRHLLKMHPQGTAKKFMKKLGLSPEQGPAFSELFRSVVEETFSPEGNFSISKKEKKKKVFGAPRGQRGESPRPSQTILEIDRRDKEGYLYGHLLGTKTILPLLALSSDDLRTMDQLYMNDHVAVRVGRRRGSPVAFFLRRVPRMNEFQVGSYTRLSGGQGIVTPAQRRFKAEWIVKKSSVPDLTTGDLVLVQTFYPSEEVHVVEKLGRDDDPRLMSLIALYNQDIPFDFPESVLEEASKGQVPSLKGRVDLRHLPLVTIDGADARDFDDAVYACPDGDEGNPGGWRLMVAIADVSYYVQPFSALDREAQKRGNSVYFPDRVVPMLPEFLSNGLCSLQPHVDRACLAVELVINQAGQLLHFEFMRGLMKSAARLTYEEVYRIYQNRETKHPLWGALSSLFSAYEVLAKARQNRGALELEVPEYKAHLSESGEVKEVALRERLPSHQLIEEFMICANVAAARMLEKHQRLCLYRIHDEPDPAKIVALETFMAQEGGIRLPALPSQLQARHLNEILKEGSQSSLKPLLSDMILRSQSQARYSSDNIGHFGLHLTHYAHFTSPIRRYADLLVHRGIVSVLTGDRQVFPYIKKELQGIADHISMTERRATAAERETMERYLCHFMKDRVGTSFEAYVSTVTKFALFVVLLENGASGIIPIENLGAAGGRISRRYDDRTQTLKVGRQSYGLGQFLRVSLEEVQSLTGRLVFRPLA